MKLIFIFGLIVDSTEKWKYDYYYGVIDEKNQILKIWKDVIIWILTGWYGVMENYSQPLINKENYEQNN